MPGVFLHRGGLLEQEGGSSSPQPSFANVVFLPDHENAVDGSNTIADNSVNNFSTNMIAVLNQDGDPDFSCNTAFESSISTAHVEITSGSAAFNPGSGEFCLEAEIKGTSFSVSRAIITRYDAGSGKRSYIFAVDSSATLFFIGSTDGADSDNLCSLNSSPTTISLNTKYHVAVSRENGFSGTPGSEDIIRLFIDGAVVDSVQIASGVSFFGSDPTPTVGAWTVDTGSGTGGWSGRVSNVRVVVGEPLYTGPFSIPTLPHPTS